MRDNNKQLLSLLMIQNRSNEFQCILFKVKAFWRFILIGSAKKRRTLLQIYPKIVRQSFIIIVIRITNIPLYNSKFSAVVEQTASMFVNAKYQQTMITILFKFYMTQAL